MHRTKWWKTRAALVPLLAGLAGAARAEDTRPSISVLPLEAKTGVVPSTAELLTETLTESVRQTGAFSRVVGLKEIETLLGMERQRQLLDCTSESCAAELAGALGVGYVLSGSMGRLGRAAIVNARIINARNGNVIASTTLRFCAEDEEALSYAVDSIVAELFQKSVFPDAKVKPVVRTPPADCDAKPGTPSTTSSGRSVPKGALGAAGGVGIAVAVFVGVLGLSSLVTGGSWITTVLAAPRGFARAAEALPGPNVGGSSWMFLVWGTPVGLVAAGVVGTLLALGLLGAGAGAEVAAWAL